MFLSNNNLHKCISKVHKTVQQVYNTFITKATNDYNYIFEMLNDNV